MIINPTSRSLNRFISNENRGFRGIPINEGYSDEPTKKNNSKKLLEIKDLRKSWADRINFVRNLWDKGDKDTSIKGALILLNEIFHSEKSNYEDLIFPVVEFSNYENTKVGGLYFDGMNNTGNLPYMKDDISSIWKPTAAFMNHNYKVIILGWGSLSAYSKIWTSDILFHEHVHFTQPSGLAYRVAELFAWSQSFVRAFNRNPKNHSYLWLILDGVDDQWIMLPKKSKEELGWDYKKTLETAKRIILQGAGKRKALLKEVIQSWSPLSVQHGAPSPLKTEILKKLP